MAKPRQNSTTKPPTLEMIINLAGFIAGVLAKLSFEQIQTLLKNKNTILRAKLMEVFDIATSADSFAEVRVEWQKFYGDHFAILEDFVDVTIPEKPREGSWRLVFIPMGLTLNATLAVMRKKFKVWTYQEDLDKHVTTNTRNSSKSYAVWVRDGIEPDEKYLGKSTREADLTSTIGMTLLERMVLEFKYFIETGNHLDSKGVTFCTGSRNSGGHVPFVCWDPGTRRVYVHWYSVDYSNAACGLREAVSR